MASPDLKEASRQVGEDIHFQRRVWRFQRFGWGAMAVLVLLATLGVFGGGPLAKAKSSSADGTIEVEWERIERIGRDSRLRIRTVGPPTAPLTLRLEGGLAEVTLSAIEPQPRGESRAPGRVWLRFDPPAEGHAAEIVLNLRSAKPGIVQGQLALGDAVLPLRLFVLP
ncbi:hypothetical protein [Roseomonas xinghualingensis]|uniref:hypothetical protein n=1 Tax=Roseomonas xinghualingensis TaxID=2986475 RepID=UPI0021F150D8|nr:hypothetical protein [Roseomonas sp. SXEYE001]MCV4208082.1 hypothetical protein [Roseomonas sp. SXEYE001]